MTLKKGEFNESPEEKNKSTNDEQYLRLIADLTKRLEEVEKNRLTQAVSGSGMNVDDIAKIIKAMNDTKKEIKYEDGIYEEEIPVGEFLPESEWVRFFVPAAGYVISDDIRKGLLVRLPFGKKAIFFEYLTESKKMDGKHVVITPVAAYTSKLKSEIEWIRNHSKHNVIIFESTATAINTDADRALRLARVMDVLKAKDYPSVIRDAQSLGITIVQDADALRRSVAIEMVDRQYANEKNSNYERAGESFKHALLVADKSTVGAAMTTPGRS